MKLRFASDEEQAGLEANPDTYRARPERNEVIRFPGTGAPGDEVQLQNTPVPAPGVPLPAAPYEKPGGGGQGPRDFSDRAGFEQFVFNQIGGNPFGTNVIAEVDRATNEDLPKLFHRVFQGQVIWQDRNRLDKDQADFWQNEVKRYRAHVKERLEADRSAKVEMYKHMMGQFEADAKEQAEAEKRVREREKEWMSRLEKDREAKEKRHTASLKRLSDLQKGYREIMKSKATIIEKGRDPITQELTPEAAAELQALEDQLGMVAGETDQLKMDLYPGYAKKKLAETKESAPAHKKAEGATPSEAAPSAATPAPAAEKPTAKEGRPAENSEPAGPGDFKPHPTKGPPIEVRRHKSGRYIGKFADGSVEFLTEK